MLENCLKKKSGEQSISSIMTRRKEQEDKTENERRDRKSESNDNPEIPDRRKTSDIPGLHSGAKHPSYGTINI